MKAKGVFLVVLGVLGGLFVFFFDILLKKPFNYLGPKSMIALVGCAILAITGARILLKDSRRPAMNKRQIIISWLIAVVFCILYAWAVFMISDPLEAWWFMVTCVAPALLIGALLLYFFEHKK
jgi:hypothetical protein